MGKGVHGSEAKSLAANGWARWVCRYRGADQDELENTVYPIEGGRLTEPPVSDAFLPAGVNGPKGFDNWDLRPLDTALLLPVGDFVL